MKRRLPGDFGVVTAPADATAAVLDRSDDCTLDFDESDVWNFAYGSNMSQVRACVLSAARVLAPISTAAGTYLRAVTV